MIVFYISSAKHLAALMPFKRGNYICKQFSDGEYYIRLQEEVARKSVWVIAATNTPTDNLMELFLLLNVLHNNNAKIHLLFTYFGYARQDNPLSSEASSAQMICTFLNTFSIEKIIILHVHSPLLHEFLNFENVIPTELMCHSALTYDAIAAPDQGAYNLVNGLSKKCDMEAIFLTKIRPEQEMVKILEYDGIVKAKKILIIDDIIATGNTVIEVAKTLAQLGATDVSVWATHGIFSNKAVYALEKSSIKKVYVTNTLPQQKNSPKIEVVSIASLCEQIIKKY